MPRLNILCPKALCYSEFSQYFGEKASTFPQKLAVGNNPIPSGSSGAGLESSTMGKGMGESGPGGKWDAGSGQVTMGGISCTIAHHIPIP